MGGTGCKQWEELNVRLGTDLKTYNMGGTRKDFYLMKERDIVTCNVVDLTILLTSL